ncbi:MULTISPECIES: TonB-dependent receptor [Asticcacaulis]|uniref:TonB-dependent receptor n=1 Tax=Asticcacaulis TaxID=76890 RepID=UPI001AE5F7D6|nr:MULTISPECIES: TonB-dependent receptor [Asticcacaulis]MBP2161018.1 TonB-dependent receptor [Asticcacaulis solisilvae]MDR6802063.1 TonB-dependent receptor [Asticcacaulis sp. BE141]
MKDLYSAGLRAALMGTVAVAAVMAAPAMAQEKAFNIPAQDATSAVPSFVQQSDLQVLAAASELRGIRTNAVQGNMTADAALDTLISGTGLTVKSRAGNSVVLARAATAENAASPAAAEAPAESEDVVVVGMRKSMRDALDVKRRQTGVMEAIAAKDIGVLPDVTIAESIARLPGVNTTRDRGNDSQAAIRGIGPRMVLGTVNGREVASSEPDRNVRWEIYPSEVVSGVSVYKSSQASLIAGGISGTVDIQTIRPLEYRGPELVARAGAVYYDGGTALPDYDGLGYRASGSFVKKLTPEFAFVIGVTAQQQKNGYESFQGWGYNDDSIRPANSTGPIVTGGPKVPTPWGAQAEAKFLTADRYSVSTGFQYRPSENFQLTYDLLYSNFKIDEHQNQQVYGGLGGRWGNWAGGNTGQYTNPVIVNGDLVGATTAYDTVTSLVAQYTENKDLIVTGLNGRWTYDQWTVTADASYSSAERSNLWQAARMQYYPATMTWLLDGDDPFVTVSDQPQNTAQSVEWQPGEAAPGRLKDELSALSFDARRDLSGGFLTAIEFGARFADRTKSEMTTANTQAQHLTGVTTLPTSLFTSYEFKNFKLPSILDGDFDEIVTAAYGAGALDLDPESLAYNSTVSEKVAEAYVQARYETTWFGKPTDGNFGVRAVSVDSESIGDSVSGGAWFQDTSGNWAFYPLVLTSAKGGSDYTKLLPSATARIELNDGVYLKLGAAQVLSRPPLNELKANRSLSPTAPYTGSSGNPYLKPFEATQIDVSYENYFDKDALFAIAGYYKQIENYVGYNQRTETINGNPYTLVSPVNKTDSGYIAGLEFTFQTPFSFIPGFEKFGIYSNLALVDSDIEEFVPTNNPLTMNGVADTTGTLDLWYSDGTFEARLGAKYHSTYTALYGWDSSALVSVEPETTVDFSASYNVNAQVSLRFQAANLLDTPLRAYDDNKENRLRRMDYYGRRFLFDVTVKY